MSTIKINFYDIEKIDIINLEGGSTYNDIIDTYKITEKK